MLSIQKLTALCLSSALILLVSADPDLNPCDNSDEESSDSNYLKYECMGHYRSKYDFFYGCLEKINDKYMVKCITNDDKEMLYPWTGPDPEYNDEPSTIIGGP